MKLSELLESISYDKNNIPEKEISDLAYDSRKAGEGIAFVCLVGASADGHSFAESAYKKGSRVFFCERELELPSDSIQIIVENTRKALAELSCAFFKNPSKELFLIGITGTKGKTTSAHIIRSVLCEGGVPCGIIGTVGAEYMGVSLETVNTTPESYETQRILRKMADAGCKACVMEVSSLGIKHSRVDSLSFSLGIFTNLYPDHIGTNEHKDMEEYAYWKKELFYRCKKALLNFDDPFSEEIKRASSAEIFTYGLDDRADYVLGNQSKFKDKNVLGTKFEVYSKGKAREFSLALPGEINAQNALTAIFAGDCFGLSDEDIQKGLSSVFVKGRCEFVRADDDVTSIIDYAHNGISLKSIVDIALSYEHKNIICVYGSVGDRTQCRRMELGMTAGELGVFSVLTSDDPGFEDPETICGEIASYIDKTPAKGKYIIEPDRAKAVEKAVAMAQKGDIIIFAGKGHEKFMKVKGEKLPFDEKEEIINAFKKKREGLLNV